MVRCRSEIITPKSGMYFSAYLNTPIGRGMIVCNNYTERV